ncbi:Gfo/Idh/MocA family protein [Paenibacillus yanchengensis]|uniref:Gfo/Idh/MocA family protein n=1 Tax=Paenibacillus yanchengensis TaxID=2035833 RepID=A0ABW4YF30_9BACL
MKKLKVGMISFAHAGHPENYLKGLLKHASVEVIGIADEQYDRVSKWIEEKGLTYYDNYHDLLQTDCDAVIICSEYMDHAQITIDAAKAGKHILCEKPLGLSNDEMETMVRICKQYNVQLMTAFPCRYLTSMIEVKEIIARGEIGDIIAIKGTNRGVNPGHWFIDSSRSGGGSIMDHTVHIMDLMNWLLDCPVKEVYAEASTVFYNIDVDDCGLVHIKFANDVIAVIDTSWSLTDSFPMIFDVTMEITGTKGVISVDAMAQNNEIYSDRANKAQWIFWGDDLDYLLVTAFVDALLHNKVVPITGEDGYKATAVALAAYESLQRKAPVPMAIYADEVSG